MDSISFNALMLLVALHEGLPLYETPVRVIPRDCFQAEPIIQKRNKTEQVCKLSWVLEHISVIVVTYYLRVYLGMLAFKVQLCAAGQ